MCVCVCVYLFVDRNNQHHPHRQSHTYFYQHNHHHQHHCTTKVVGFNSIAVSPTNKYTPLSSRHVDSTYSLGTHTHTHTHTHIPSLSLSLSLPIFLSLYLSPSLSLHPSALVIVLDSSSRLHPMPTWTDWWKSLRLKEHRRVRRTLLMSLSTLPHFYLACLVRLTLMVCVMGQKWPNSCCFVGYYFPDFFPNSSCPSFLRSSNLAFLLVVHLESRWWNYIVVLIRLHLRRSSI